MAALSSATTILLALLICKSCAFDPIAEVGNDYRPNSSISEDRYKLPTGFIMGAASAAFQIEGGWNADGKGPSIWDNWLHERPEYANGDVADDSYHKYKEDALLLKNTKLQAYRFSISWPRVLPNGTIDNINQAGIDYYNNVIDELVNKSIVPMVTLYHWDLPVALEEKGGWAGDSSIQDAFVDYARLAFEKFGDRVTWWITFNEPHSFCSTSYENGVGSMSANEPGVGYYECAHNVLVAHAKVYQMYQENYAATQGGQVGMTMDCTFATPLTANNKQDSEAADRYMQFIFGLYADPVIFGDYPALMKTVIDGNSKSEGRNVSRLPPFTADEKKILTMSADFIGVNHYAAALATAGVPECTDSPSFNADMAVTTSTDPSWSLGKYWSTKTPWGMRGVLNWIKDRYSNFPVVITENGYDGNDEEALNDYNRVSYLSTYLRAMFTAIEVDNCNILGYFTWSLLDNLEWQQGYKQRFGIHYVDFNDPNRKRTPKKSATFLKYTMMTQKVTYYGFM